MRNMLIKSINILVKLVQQDYIKTHLSGKENSTAEKQGTSGPVHSSTKTVLLVRFVSNSD